MAAAVTLTAKSFILHSHRPNPRCCSTAQQHRLDIAPQYAGFLHGIANSAGTLAAIISTIGTGYFVQWLGSFQAFLTVTAVLYFISAIFWNLYATGERVF